MKYQIFVKMLKGQTRSFTVNYDNAVGFIKIISGTTKFDLKYQDRTLGDFYDIPFYGIGDEAILWQAGLCRFVYVMVLLIK